MNEKLIPFLHYETDYLLSQTIKIQYLVKHWMGNTDTIKKRIENCKIAIALIEHIIDLVPHEEEK